MKLFWSLEQNNRKPSGKYASIHRADCRDVSKYVTDCGGSFFFEAETVLDAMEQIYEDVDPMTDSEKLAEWEGMACPCCAKLKIR